MADSNVVDVQLREPGSSNQARRLRREGILPAVLYGGDHAAQVIAVDPRRVVEILQSESGQNTILTLKLPDKRKKQTVMINDFQVHPLTHRLLHADFLRISMDQPIEVNVPVLLVGEPQGVRIDHGVLEQIFREVHVKCLPSDIPEHFEIDVTELKIGDVAHVSDIDFPEDIELLEDLERPVASVAAPRVEIEEEEEEEEDLLDLEPKLIRPDREGEEGEEPEDKS